MYRRFAFLLVSVLGLALLPTARSQQPPPTPQGERSKAKKVWTNEDLAKLRSPADEFAAQKQTDARAALPQRAAPPQAAPNPKQRPVTRDAFDPPKTIADAEFLIAAKRVEIGGQQELIRRTREEFFLENREAVRRDLEKTIARLTADLAEAQSHLRLLEASLAELNSKPGPKQP